MTEENIYTIALKYGADNLNNGITYNNLLSHLKSKGKSLDKDIQRYFHVWFYENFYVDAIYPKIKDFRWTSGDLGENVLAVHDDKKAILTGNSHQMYLDYQELRFAYKSSKQATWIAIWAIIVTIVIGILQIIVSICQNYNR